MKRLLLLTLTLTLLLCCREKAVDPTKRVRPVSLRIEVDGSGYRLIWEPIRLVCVTAPCPDVADVEAGEYEVQLADGELGIFRTYRILGADTRSVTVPADGREGQLVARIVSKAKGAPPAYSVAVMATHGFLSQSAHYPGFGLPEEVTGGDVTPDGTQVTFHAWVEEGPGQYALPLYVAELQNERAVSAKPVNPLGGAARFSPDGLQLAYPSRSEHGLVIFTIASGQAQILPVLDADRIRGLDWSPDGMWLAFTTVSAEESRLWKMAVAGGPAIPLTPALPVLGSNQIRPADLDWSPDGRFIAVSRARSDAAGQRSRAVISLYSPEGGGEVRYFETQPGWVDTNPAFSPDGRQLAFLSTRADPSARTHSLWVRDLATGGVRRIELLPGLDPSDDYVPHWLGHERLLFMATQRGKKGYFTVFL